MPELPEVEVVARGLREKILGKFIKNVDVKHPKVVGGESHVAGFVKSLNGASITKVERHGKLLFLKLSTKHTLVVHLKLTGQLIFIDKDGKGYKGGHTQKVYDTAPPHKHTHIIISFSDGSHLYFNDLRRFGWMKVVATNDLPKVAPDPTLSDFDKSDFIKRVQKHPKISVYKALLDQTVVSGMGNIYVNELLWRCKIYPLILVSKLPRKNIDAIANAIKPLLLEAIKYGGSSANTFVKIDGSKGTFTDHLDVYHREGKPCHRKDGGTVARVKVGGRSTFFCPMCQKKAD